MIWNITGTLSFGILVLFEYSKCQSARKGIKRYNPWFLIGTALLLLSWLMLFLRGPIEYNKGFGAGITVLAIGAALYVYVMTIPVDKKGYAKDGLKTPVSRKGFYSKVRHPGVWCFLMCSIATGIAVPEAFVSALWFALLNLLYVWLQDKYFFPVYLEGYEEYKKETRFL
ncbi:MAG: hypothetical protein GX663_01765 [Clostridiales bacterium]|nr:hypothetical protein [Clostridiales bacterium]